MTQVERCTDIKPSTRAEPRCAHFVSVATEVASDSLPCAIEGLHSPPRRRLRCDGRHVNADVVELNMLTTLDVRAGKTGEPDPACENRSIRVDVVQNLRAVDIHGDVRPEGGNGDVVPHALLVDV